MTPNVRVLMTSLFRQRRHRYQQAIYQNKVQSVVVTVFMVGFFIGATMLFSGLFRSLKTLFKAELQDIQQVLSFVMPLMFSCLFVMLCFSNGIMSWVSFFKDKDTKSLVVWPLEFKEIYIVKFIESFFFSAWAFFFLAGPLFIGYDMQYEVSSIYLVSIMMISFAFAVMAGGTGTLIAVLIARFLPRFRKQFIIFLLVALGSVLVWVYFTFMRQRPTIDGAFVLNIQKNFTFMLSSFFPPGWMYRGFVGAIEGNAKEVVFMFGLLLSHGLMFLHVGGMILSRSYLKCRERIFVSKKSGTKGWLYKVIGPASDRSAMSLLMWKDLKIFVRDPAQWLQLLLFFGLLFVYFANLRKFEVAQNQFQLSYVATLNLSATLLTLSTFTTRFVFPQLSLEGQRFWFLGLVPLKREKIVKGKFIFAFVGCFLIAGTLTVVSVSRLGLSPIQIPIQLLLSMSVSLGLVGLACGLGVVFANYKAQSATKVLSGFGGTLNLVMSAVFLILEMFLAYPAIARVEEVKDFADPLVLSSFLICLTLGVLTAIIPLNHAVRHLEQTEF